MKRLIPALIILIITVTACYLANNTADKYCQTIQSHLKSCEENFIENNYAEAEKIAKNLATEWRKKQAVLAIFVNHNPLDGVTKSINQLNAGIKSRDTASFLMSYYDAEFFLMQICKEQRLESESFY